jgi:uncharacterized damage-inducible protein DinB
MSGIALPSRPTTPFDLGERELLERFLDFHRATIHLKVAGLSDDDAWRRLVPSLTSAAGLVKHLTFVEQTWFRARLAGVPDLPVPWDAGNPDGDFVRTAGDTVDSLLAAYAAECDRSREVAADMALDDVGAVDLADGRPTLRWVLVHMIEETGRHNGQLDILRELTDGATGE